MSAGIFYNGRRIISPAVVSAVDDSAMYNRGLSVGNVLAVVGTSSAGEPYAVQRFGSASEARAALRSGDLMDAVTRAFAPSSETGGPALVVGIRVSNATKSTATLSDGANPCALLESADYGVFTTGINIRADAASGGVGRKMTISLGTSSISQDNVLRRMFSLRYTGTGTTATASANGTELTLNVDSTVVATVPFSTYKTVADLVSRINATAGWVASVLDGNGSREVAGVLDWISSSDAKTAQITVTAHLQAVIDWLNSAGSGFVKATRTGTNVGMPSISAGAVFLTGGTDGATPTVADWQKAFDALQLQDVQWVVPLSTNPAVHAMADAHCGYMSGVGGQERRAIVGTALATSDADAITAAKALNSDRTGLVHLGAYDYDPDGNYLLYPPPVVAAMIAAGFCGQNPGNAMTNKSLRLRGLERRLRNPTDTDVLLEGGVIPVEETSTGFRVVQSISTWLTNANYNRRELSCGVATDYTVRAVREALKDIVGRKGNPVTMALAKSKTETVLAALAVAEPNGPAVLAGDDANPAFKNIQVSLIGDRLSVEFQCSPVIPVNYVTVTVHVVPYSGTASA